MLPVLSFRRRPSISFILSAMSFLGLGARAEFCSSSAHGYATRPPNAIQVQGRISLDIAAPQPRTFPATAGDTPQTRAP
ncbi:hypothetical protein B0H16DRAFT_1593882 [Mycena metata]|uniref:Uncharacterized protein n=1 Tax=Mycena metata TaxID=1033252 RepID=A0AAD7HQ62_9AGAR|nr:hypothetical protein B0H16DRAFT_1593882 [Mycena metata]